MTKMSEVVVIDYGVGNLLSVRRALEHCGASVQVTSDPELILDAPKVVLPGVGAFSKGMEELGRRGLDVVVREVAANGVPLLGICLGMQMLLDKSDEFGMTAGLGLIPGRVIAVPTTSSDGHTQKIPHIGWNSLVLPQGYKSWQQSLLHDIKQGAAVYFVHSFMASPSSPEDRIADCLYGDVPVSAVIGRNNVFGCQFHPEKSGDVGLQVLKNFLGQ
jgi:imidazole glycerol-phosphate synthase subunit HisH